MAKRKRTTSKRSSTRAGVDLGSLLGILAGDVRRIILLELARSPREVTALAEAADAEISVVSHNLRRLRDAGLVVQTPVSRQRVYELTRAVKTSRRGNKLTLTIPATAGESVTITAT